MEASGVDLLGGGGLRGVLGVGLGDLWGVLGLSMCGEIGIVHGDALQVEVISGVAVQVTSGVVGQGDLVHGLGGHLDQHHGWVGGWVGAGTRPRLSEVRGAVVGFGPAPEWGRGAACSVVAEDAQCGARCVASVSPGLGCGVGIDLGDLGMVGSIRLIVGGILGDISGWRDVGADLWAVWGSSVIGVRAAGVLVLCVMALTVVWCVVSLLVLRVVAAFLDSIAALLVALFAFLAAFFASLPPVLVVVSPRAVTFASTIWE